MMSYRLGFDGVASPEVSRLLSAVEGRLNLHAVNWQGVQAQAVDVGSKGVGTPGNPCKPGENCVYTPPENPPNAVVALIGTFAIGLVAGVLIGYFLGKRAGSVAR